MSGFGDQDNPLSTVASGATIEEAEALALMFNLAPVMADEVARLRGENAELREANGDMIALCSLPAFSGTVDEFEAWLATDGSARPKIAMSRAEILRLREALRAAESALTTERRTVEELRVGLHREADSIADIAQAIGLGNPTRANLYAIVDRLRTLAGAR